MCVRLVIVRGDAAKLFDAIAKLFNCLELGVAHRIVEEGLTTLALRLNNSASTARSRGFNQRVGEIAVVGNEIGQCQFDELGRDVEVLTLRQAVLKEAAVGIGLDVRLASQAAAAVVQVLRPIFLDNLLACLYTCTVVKSSCDMCNTSSYCTVADIWAHPSLRVKRWKRAYVVCEFSSRGRVRHRDHCA